MQYFSTHHKAPKAHLKEAILRGLAPDGGLYMPETIAKMPDTFFEALPQLALPEIAYSVSKHLFGEDVPEAALKNICEQALDFDTPLVKLTEQIHVLELFHGPTCAFKDVGGRFMARMLAHFMEKNDRETFVLTATSGDTGSAVASGFFGVEGIRVILLYPKGKVSRIQEQQLTTHGGNITAIEVDGTFDDCQKLVKTAFVDDALNDAMTLTSANSINLARFLPQSFYYFHAWGQLEDAARKAAVFAVPSGNFGNLTAGLFAHKMGLPIHRFIAATNINDVVPEYLETADYRPRPSVRTLANAMDVGNPSNFVRILALFEQSHPEIAKLMRGFRLDDTGIRKAIRAIYQQHTYIADPHGAIGYEALVHGLVEGEYGVFLETAHPAKFPEVVEQELNQPVPIPDRLAVYLKKEKKAVALGTAYETFKAFLLSQR